MSHTEWMHTAIFGAGFLVLFSLGEVLYHILKAPVEISRKFVHMGTGIICLLLPIYFETHWSILILNVSFIAILGITKKLNWLKSINAIERKSSGSVLFPIIMYITWCIYLYVGDVLYFYLPVLILAICDPIAALVGKKWPKGQYEIMHAQKTLTGSSAFFVSSLMLCLIFLIPLRDQWVEIILISVVVSLLTTIAEAFSQKGFDNLFIPLTVCGTLFGMDYLLNLS